MFRKFHNKLTGTVDVHDLKLRRFEFVPSLESAAVSLPNLDEGYFAKVVLENNKYFRIWEDICSLYPRWIIECENQPRDMPIFGIWWKAVQPEMSGRKKE